MKTTNGGLAAELDLRRRGFVPMTSYDATSPSLVRALPACRVRQRVDREEHGRVVWSHPGRSGLDPRAVGPLSLVRVADGLGPRPLDASMTLGQALRWLLDGDVEQWLLRPQHRARLVPCRYDSVEGCLTHPVTDPLAQEVAEALGDSSVLGCTARSTPTTDRWAGAPPKDAHLGRLAMRALGVTLRLADWYRDGVRGADAWELARHGVLQCCLDEWPGGLSRVEVVRWCAQERPRTITRQRDQATVVDLPLVLPPPPPSGTKDRGMNGYQAWGMSRHGQGHRILTCPTCGAKDLEQPCRTCRAAGPPAKVDREWSSFAGFAKLHEAYSAVDPGRAVACGHGTCG